MNTRHHHSKSTATYAVALSCELAARSVVWYCTYGTYLLGSHDSPMVECRVRCTIAARWRAAVCSHRYCNSACHARASSSFLLSGVHLGSNLHLTLHASLPRRLSSRVCTSAVSSAALIIVLASRFALRDKMAAARKPIPTKISVDEDAVHESLLKVMSRRAPVDGDSDYALTLTA